MRISDVSSDVCSSDLRSLDCLIPMLKARAVPAFYAATRGWGLIDHNLVAADVEGRIGTLEIGRASCRERVCQYVSISEVGESFKKKNQTNHTEYTTSRQYTYRNQKIVVEYRQV